MNDKKYAQKVWSKDLVYKKPFGYRVIHQNSLTSCSGHDIPYITHHWVFGERERALIFFILSHFLRHKRKCSFAVYVIKGKWFFARAKKCAWKESDFKWAWISLHYYFYIYLIVYMFIFKNFNILFPNNVLKK